ncbi:demethylmenaquinone methyltransferase [Actinomadura sp. HBU206391]|uniref:demethylmenaquinone methyltransferase n=1 Tax=Actinomadura sp. HBU206391 TaxID=2731692 RepID=UPI00164F143B|nr:demethylmenaquinone methyltransferase [Actinomadura sp. HBU206391]MBC6457693.1 demethylmenaquinone methyltransferase [Actinomadura sp. HBU206391]
MTRASLDKQPADVAAMFDRTAERYDLLNGLMTVGQDRRWRGLVRKAVDARPGELILDLAGGTGTSSVPFVAAGARCVTCDFSLGMLRVGARRNSAARSTGRLGFVAGDALRLPFGDGAFDAVTISFGLRNVADTGQALREMLRVTRPGGRLVVCEVSRPPNAVLAFGHRLHLKYGLPLLAKASSNPDSYTYLAESTLAWPDQAALAARLGDAGWESVRWRNLSLGVVALHHGRKPA